MIDTEKKKTIDYTDKTSVTRLWCFHIKISAQTNVELDRVLEKNILNKIYYIIFLLIVNVYLSHSPLIFTITMSSPPSSPALLVYKPPTTHIHTVAYIKHHTTHQTVAVWDVSCSYCSTKFIYFFIFSILMVACYLDFIVYSSFSLSFVLPVFGNEHFTDEES